MTNWICKNCGKHIEKHQLDGTGYDDKGIKFCDEFENQKNGEKNVRK